MDPVLEGGYGGIAPVVAVLVRLDLPDDIICLTDGGFANYDGFTYLGEHPDYGVLSKVSEISDGAEVTTTRVNITILPSSDIAVADLGSPFAQGSRVRWWEAVVDPSTGLLIGEPELKFDGELDKPSFSVGASWEMMLECGTQAERQVEANADWRLNHAFHTTIWPGETGLEFVTSVTRKLEWRERPPNPGLFKRLMHMLVPLTK